MRVVFVNQGLFDGNSGGHIAGFANALVPLGVSVTVVAWGDAAGATAFGPPRFQAISREGRSDDEVLQLVEPSLADPTTLLHAWTPREQVRTLVEAAAQRWGRRYLVHLEDNESLLRRVMTEPPWSGAPGEPPVHLSHPRRGRALLEKAAGVTCITPELGDFVPPGVPWCGLTPGVDAQAFRPTLNAAERLAARSRLGVGSETFCLVYHGNTHAVNRLEIGSLYAAVASLRRSGRDVVLLRTGGDAPEPNLDVQHGERREGVRSLGWVPRAELPRVLELADAFVQPGRRDAFNVYRLPSKLPEFLAMARPVVTPDIGLGAMLGRSGSALTLQVGDAAEIAAAVSKLMDDPALRDRLASAGRDFAIRQLSWDCAAARLKRFYESL